MYHGDPSHGAMDVACHWLSSEPPKRNFEVLWLPSPSYLSNTYHAFMFELETFSSFFPYGIDLRRYKCVGLVLEFFMLVKMVTS